MYTVEDVEFNQIGRIGKGQFGMTISTGRDFIAPGSPEWHQVLDDGNTIKRLLKNATITFSVSFSKMTIIADR